MSETEHILVLGDMFVDEYHICSPGRMDQTTPIHVMNEEQVP